MSKNKLADSGALDDLIDIEPVITSNPGSLTDIEPVITSNPGSLTDNKVGRKKINTTKKSTENKSYKRSIDFSEEEYMWLINLAESDRLNQPRRVNNNSIVKLAISELRKNKTDEEIFNIIRDSI